MQNIKVVNGTSALRRTCYFLGSLEDYFGMLCRIGLTKNAIRILVALAVLTRVSDFAPAQQRSAVSEARLEMVFDIPSQPLATALGVYGATSRVQVLYESGLTAHKTSTAVKGTFTPEAALRALLAGTGLVGHRTDIDAITVMPEPREHSASAAAGVVDTRFLGALQTGILEVLCTSTDTRPGAYRMALQLWITPAGILQRASLLGSTGNERRDKALIAQLRDIRLVVRPPPDLAQPITLAIVPRSPLQPSECIDR